MQANCVWGLFTCDLQVKLPAFAGKFARASFTVHFRGVESFRYYWWEEITEKILKSDSEMQISREKR